MTASWRRTNLGHLLFAATGRCMARKLAVVHQSGYAEMTSAQLTLFEHIDEGGTRLTALAARAGLTKQSMIELVDRAENGGLVERHADPLDRRAKIVRPTAQGRRVQDAAHAGMAQAEREFVDAIAPLDLAVVQSELHTLTSGPARSHVIEHLLSDASRRFASNVLGEVHRHGYREVTDALIALFRTLELPGSRLTDVAFAARITKQSMRDLVERAETLGLVERSQDQNDRRAKTIQFSHAGLAMLEEMRRGVERAEADFADRVGQPAFSTLKTALNAYLASP